MSDIEFSIGNSQVLIYFMTKFRMYNRGANKISTSSTPDFVKSKKIFSTEDAINLARKRQPRIAFDLIEGASGREVAVKRNRSQFDNIILQPRVMANVETRDISTDFLGNSYDLPFGIAPMGMCNLAWPNTDKMLSKAAVNFNIPHCASTAASSTLEEIRENAGKNAWFQLYVAQTVENAIEMVERAKVAGYETLILTVDVPQVSRRVRDLRNGLQMPFHMGIKQFIDFALHPHWSLASFKAGAPETRNFDASKFDRTASRAGADWNFLDKIRELWKGKLIVKGITSAEDAIRVQKAGVDAIYVSNHGGRQLDSAPAAIDILPKIRAAVGADYPLIFDSGISNGEDIVKALALGANFVMVGRPMLYAAGAEGQIGVDSLISIIAQDISLTLAQIGLNDVKKLSSDVVIEPKI